MDSGGRLGWILGGSERIEADTSTWETERRRSEYDWHRSLFADVLRVVVLSANPIGARVGVLMAGLFMAISCFVWTAPLNVLLLAGFLCVPSLRSQGC
jgi:hypothetical protein